MPADAPSRRGPQDRPPTPIKPATQDRRFGMHPRERLRVLVVDDEPELASSLCLALAMAGIFAVATHDGTSALESVQDDPPHAVILDLGLPPLGGLAVATAIRQQPVLADTHLIALTGFNTPEYRAAARNAGIDTYLVKPSSIEQIVARVQAIRQGALPLPPRRLS